MNRKASSAYWGLKSKAWSYRFKIIIVDALLKHDGKVEKEEKISI